MMKSSVLPLSQLLTQVRRLKKQGKTIAFTNGCFDLLHLGHLIVLEKIKRKADCLIVAINSDASVRRLKGAGRPLVPAKERAFLVAALKPVNFVTVFSESTPRKVIEAIRPHILAKGGDWKRQEIVGAQRVRASGGQVVVVPYVKNHSTTQLLGRIQRLGRKRRRRR